MRILEHAITSWDRTMFQAINERLGCPLLDRIMPRISDLGLGHVQVLAILLAALFAGLYSAEVRGWRDMWPAMASRRCWVVPLLVAFIISGLGSTLIKAMTTRDRPWWYYHNQHEEGRDLGVHVRTMVGRRPLRVRGFLSGHTATSAAIAMTVTLLLWLRRVSRWRAWSMLAWGVAMLIGLSRIYIADHWPVDVVCGTILGVVSGYAAIWLTGARRYAVARTGDNAGASGAPALGR